MKVINSNGICRNDLLRISIGVIYCWFGFLKFYPELSPAEELAKNTLSILTFGLVPDSISYTFLAIWECTVGVMLVFNFFPRSTIFITLLHMVGTFIPLVLMQDTTFGGLPMSLTFTGQYIMKNMIIVMALLSIYPSKKHPKKEGLSTIGFCDSDQSIISRLTQKLMDSKPVRLYNWSVNLVVGSLKCIL